MTKALPAMAILPLLFAGCALEEQRPRYAHRCAVPATTACGGSAVVVQLQSPAPAPPGAYVRCPAHRRGGAGCAPAPGPVADRRSGCVYVRGRWIRVRRGWQLVRHRWVCPR